MQRRADTFSFRIAVPVELRSIVGGREFTKTLRTTDKKVAIPLALELAAIAKRLFNQLREDMTKLDNEKLREGVQRAKHKLQLDEQHESHDKQLIDLRRGHLKELELARLKAHNEALRSVLASQASADVSIATPSLKSASAKHVAVQHRISDIMPIWKRLKKPSLATIEIYEYAASRFLKQYPELNVESIEKRHILEYVAWLQSEGKKAKTIDKEVGVLRALLNIAEHEEWISGNPASRVLLPAKKDGTDIRSYKPDELRLIFSSPVFKDGLRPVAGKGEAAYWVPLLLLFSGARREEICQLTTGRIRKVDDVTYFAIDPVENEGRLKTDESRRAIPVHNELVRLGFLNFVAEREAAGGGQLFPKLKTNKRGQYGAKWGDWWRRYIRQDLKITDKRVHPAHSFRHLFVTECRRLRFREDYERALVGHVSGSGRQDSHDGYGEHLVSALAAELNRIDFRGLDLSHLQPK